MSQLLLNGQAASADDLRALALVNYGHFTSMQVRGGAVQGIALHLQRLQTATGELFSSELDLASVRQQMHAAVALAPECTLRTTVFSRGFDYRQPTGRFVPDVLLSVSPAAHARAEAIRVKSFVFQRPLPHIKHVGTFPLFHHRRLALAAGHDDAVFVDAAGVLSEGSLWNLGFWDGEQVTWPDAPALRGTAEQLLQAGLSESGVGQQWDAVGLPDLGRFRAAFACNASGIQTIAGINEIVFPGAPALTGLLEKALAGQPWEFF